MAPATFDPWSPISLDEKQARFVFFSTHIRADGTVKPDAFIPHPYPDLSTTRHDGLSEREIWQRGETIALQRGKSLLGRADAVSGAYLNQGLKIQPDPKEGNPQHVNIIGWPLDKPAQKIIAQLISNNSKFKPPEVIPCVNAKNHHGKCVAVEGVIFETLKTAKGITLWNFGASFPNQALTAWAHSSLAIPTEALSEFLGKRVHLIGKVELHKGKPNIQIFSLDQMSRESLSASWWLLRFGSVCVSPLSFARQIFCHASGEAWQLWFGYHHSSNCEKREQIGVKESGFRVPLYLRLRSMLEWPGGHFMGLFEDQDSLYLYARIFKMQAAIIQVSDEHEHWEGIVDRTDWTIFVISPGVGQSIGPRKLSTFLSFRTGSNSHGASEFEDLATRSKPKALPPFDI